MKYARKDEYNEAHAHELDKQARDAEWRAKRARTRDEALHWYAEAKRLNAQARKARS